MMPACEDRQMMLNGLLDGELDAANTAATEAHLATCRDCREEFARLETLRRAIATSGARYDAPDTLRSRIESTNHTSLYIHGAVIADRRTGDHKTRDDRGWRGHLVVAAVAQVDAASKIDLPERPVDEAVTRRLRLIREGREFFFLPTLM